MANLIEVKGGPQLYSGILNMPVLVEVDDEKEGLIIVGFATGTRVKIQVDQSLPSLITDAAYAELKPLLERE